MRCLYGHRGERYRASNVANTIMQEHKDQKLYYGWAVSSFQGKVHEADRGSQILSDHL